MKKNLMTVIILALVLANLALTAILAFTIIPQTKKSNQLIDEVCMAINLDLEAGQNKNTSAIPIEDIEVFNLTENFTVTLANSGDGQKHVAIFSVGLSVNTTSEGYKKTYAGTEELVAKETIIRNEINSIVQSYTIDEFEADGSKAVKEEILETLQNMFGGPDYIVGVNFSSVNAQ